MDREIGFADGATAWVEMSGSLSKYVFALRHYGGVGPRTFRMLASYIGSPQEVLAQDEQTLLSLPRLGPRRARDICEASDRVDEAQAVLDDLAAKGIKTVTLCDDGYPARLSAISDSPPILYYRGNLEPDDKPAVAVVGTTDPDEAGIQAAVECGKRLAARGVTVSSGLARGIDASAHIGAVKGSGRTYAVLGSGLQSVFPPENRLLAEVIVENGALMSEYYGEQKASSATLLARNRVIVGLAQAVIVVQMQHNSSGSMDAISRAIDQAKPVYIYDPEGALSNEEKYQLRVQTFQSVDYLDTIVKYLV